MNKNYYLFNLHIYYIIIFNKNQHKGLIPIKIMINQTEDIYKWAHAQLKRKYSIFLVLMTKRKQNKKTLIYIYWIYLTLMAEEEGLKPSTSGFGDQRSIN